MKYITVDKQLLKMYLDSHSNGINDAIDYLKSGPGPEKANNNEWEDLIVNNTYITDVCIYADIEFLPYMSNLISNQFFGAHYLLGISLPKNIKSIGNSCFERCKNLKQVTIPNNIEHLGDNIFKDTPNLVDIIYEGTSEQFRLLAIDNPSWCRYSVIKKVHCTDKDIDIYD